MPYSLSGSQRPPISFPLTSHFNTLGSWDITAQKHLANGPLSTCSWVQESQTAPDRSQREIVLGEDNTEHPSVKYHSSL